MTEGTREDLEQHLNDALGSGSLHGRSCGVSPKAVKWRTIADTPFPPDDPFVRAIGHPGETIYPGLVVMDWQEYTQTIWEPGRPGQIESQRMILLSSERVIVLDIRQHRRTISVPLGLVQDAALITPPGKPVKLGETVIHMTFRDENGDSRFVDWAARSADAQVFVQMLDHLRTNRA